MKVNKKIPTQTIPSNRNGTQHVNVGYGVQTGTLGRPFENIGCRKNTQLPSKWIDNNEHWHWIYIFRYRDEHDGGFEIEIDYNNKFVGITKY